jgi:hypothetical protein
MKYLSVIAIFIALILPSLPATALQVEDAVDASKAKISLEKPVEVAIFVRFIVPNNLLAYACRGCLPDDRDK